MSREEIHQLQEQLHLIQHLLEEKWEKAITQTSAIGSDVKKLQSDFQKHMEEDRAFKEEMRPVLHGKRFITYLGDALKYIGLPFTAVLWFIYMLFKKEI